MVETKDLRTEMDEVSFEYGVSMILSERLTSPAMFSNLVGMRAAGNVYSDRGRIAVALGTDKKISSTASWML